ncbi:unnamed protein product [marine sediment metagenome]|uniref:Uncharacterized protein n=1 Tax=marine sediment metagenome TaxID=412755 RepID=X1U140_9ZZZZ
MVMEPLRRDAERIRQALQPPFSIEDILSPTLPLRIRQQRTGIRQLDELIDLYARTEAQLNKVAELRLTELRIIREGAARRLAQMVRLRK